MIREEIVEEVATKINSKLTSYNPIKEIIEVSNELTDYVIAHEQDTLKEFVEWYKAHLHDLVKYEKDLYTDAKNNRHENNATFFEGEISMLKRLLSWIDIKREQFLEEKE